MKIIRGVFALLLLGTFWGVAVIAAPKEAFKVVDLAKIGGRMDTVDIETGIEYRRYIESRKEGNRPKTLFVDTDIKIKNVVYKLRFSYTREDGQIKRIENFVNEGLSSSIYPIKGNQNEVLVELALADYQEIMYLAFDVRSYRYRNYLEGCNIEHMLMQNAWLGFSPNREKVMIRYYEEEEEAVSTLDNLMYNPIYEAEKLIGAYLDITKKEWTLLDDLLPYQGMEFSHWVDDSHVFLTRQRKDGYLEGYLYNATDGILKRAYEIKVHQSVYKERDGGTYDYDWTEGDSGLLLPKAVDLYKDGAYRYCFYVDEASKVYIMNKLTGKKKEIPSLKWNEHTTGMINEEESRVYIYQVDYTEEKTEREDGVVETEGYSNGYTYLAVLDIDQGVMVHLADEDALVNLKSKTIQNYEWVGNDEFVIQFAEPDHALTDNRLSRNYPNTVSIRFKPNKQKKKGKEEADDGDMVTVAMASKEATDVTLKEGGDSPIEESTVDNDDSPLGSEQGEYGFQEEASAAMKEEDGMADAADAKERNPENGKGQPLTFIWLFVTITGVITACVFLLLRKRLDNRKKSK